MGQKVNPICLRLGIRKQVQKEWATGEWTSRWFAPSKQLFVKYLQQDRQVREFMKRQLASAAVARVVIERSPEYMRVVTHTARPGVLIGRHGENIQRLQETVQKIIGPGLQLKMDYMEITNPYIEAQLVAESIGFQLEKRVAFRRAMKRSIQQATEAGAKGIKVICDGRLAGSEMTRCETYREGKVPLGTLRSDIDFGQATAHTTAGCIGIKVWVYRGDIVDLKPVARQGAEGKARPARARAEAPDPSLAAQAAS
ncbi:MAG: 30S ribosomal protein S3 [Candidatus Omnitrophica bacterium]|nr:30S ribosomal protein S3 [Candidatus Omnitrophota bacterium]